MPWCDDCDRFWNPNTLGEDGSCPTCGRVVARSATVGAPGAAGAGATAVQDAQELKAPWHFKLLVGGVVAYLAWRGWQAVEWVLHRI